LDKEIGCCYQPEGWFLHVPSGAVLFADGEHPRFPYYRIRRALFRYLLCDGIVHRFRMWGHIQLLDKL
jgi:hypothetical protein